MLGQRLNLIIILLLTVITSCGRAPELSGAPQFVAGQVMVPGDGSGLSVDRRATRTWRDYDGDGLSDRLDWDMDGDGVANLVDQYPFNEKLWGLDTNRNGLPDFVDLSLAKDPRDKSVAPLQEAIFRETRVVVIQGSARFSEAEWQALQEIVTSEQLTKKIRFSHLKALVKYDRNSQVDLRRADFDAHWQQMNLYENDEHAASLLSFRGSVIHEFGHVHALENPADFMAFSSRFASWSSPSTYGLSSPEEGYAEDFALKLYRAGLDLDPSRFDLL
jgi:hypothetical protein